MANIGSLPTTPKFQTVTIKNNQPNLVTITTSGRRQVKSQQTQYWSFEAKYPPLKRDDFGKVAGFLTKARGATNEFTIILPEYSFTNGALTTQSPIVNNSGGYSAGTTAIALSIPGAVSTTGALKAGDFIKFNDHNKVYMVVEDLDTDGSAEGTVTIEPPLVASVTNSEAVAYTNVEFTVFLDEDVQEYNTGLANIVEYEVSFREVV